MKNKKGFDYRIVRYEDIHSIEETDFSALINIINAQPTQKIFEGCAGYGAVTKRLHDTTGHMADKPQLFLLDESEAQLDQAKQSILMDSKNFISGDIRNCPFEDNFFDTVVVKMGIHEIPFEEQKKAFKEIFRILKPGGKFVMWELALSPETQMIFQDVVRKKNELAGFEIINQNRYIPRLDELHTLYDGAHFANVTEAHKINYTFESIKRFDELISRDRKLISEDRPTDAIDEITLNLIADTRMRLLNSYIRKRVPDDMKQKLNYIDAHNNIKMDIRKMIMVGYKPC